MKTSIYIPPEANLLAEFLAELSVICNNYDFYETEKN